MPQGHLSYQRLWPVWSGRRAASTSSRKSKPVQQMKSQAGLTLGTKQNSRRREQEQREPEAWVSFPNTTPGSEHQLWNEGWQRGCIPSLRVWPAAGKARKAPWDIPRIALTLESTRPEFRTPCPFPAGLLLSDRCFSSLKSVGDSDITAQGYDMRQSTSSAPRHPALT